MDKFVTVVKFSSSHASTSNGGKTSTTSKTKYKYSPYPVPNAQERSFDAWKDRKRTERILPPFQVERTSAEDCNDDAKNEDEDKKKISKRLSKSELTKQLLTTLKDKSNPITHSDIYLRTDHVISIAGGHQHADGGGRRADYFADRNKKLKEQEQASTRTDSSSVGKKSPGTGLLSTSRIYINGYLANTTDIAMKSIIVGAGGQNLRSPSGATHILTSQQLSGAKTHKHLTGHARSKPHVVRPEWVTDSIACGKRLPERLYAVIEDKTSHSLLEYGIGNGKALPGASSKQ